jgi:hypothetical protein
MSARKFKIIDTVFVKPARNLNLLGEHSGTGRQPANL